jgi:hypothetical protein
MFKRNFATRIALLTCGFDTPLTPALAGGAREEHSGLLNHRGVNGKKKS